MTREPFVRTARITTLIIEDGLTGGTAGGRKLDPEHDRFMLCGSMAMIRETAALLEERGFQEGSRNQPGTYVLERAFVG